jgi:ABC-type multidrug transport system fused ATPase/permease subunit
MSDRFYETLDEKIIRENHTQLTTDSPQTLEQNLPSAPVPTPPTLSTPSLTSTSSLFSSSPIISLNGVNYSYPTRPDRLVLQNISMSFRMQAIQIIIGKSGSGKSTLLSLLCGLYHPTVGDISISGSATSGASLNLDWVREHIGVVEQSAKLFSGTIRENICYGSQVSALLLHFVIISCSSEPLFSLHLSVGCDPESD